MTKESLSALLPSVVSVVLAVIGALVFQKVQARRAGLKSNPVVPLDDKAKAWIEDVVATPRPQVTDVV